MLRQFCPPSVHHCVIGFAAVPLVRCEVCRAEAACGVGVGHVMGEPAPEVDFGADVQEGFEQEVSVPRVLVRRCRRPKRVAGLACR